MRTRMAVFAVALACFAWLAGGRHQQVEMADVQSKAGIKFKCEKARGAFWEDSMSGRYGCTKQCASRESCTVTCERDGRCTVQLPAYPSGAVYEGSSLQQFVLGFAISRVP